MKSVDKSTSVYIALLRGINVSGHKMIKMEDLRRALNELGFSGIATYIQSGNILFSSSNSDPLAMARDIAGKILQHFGHEVPVVIRSLDELEQVYANNPLCSAGDRDPGKMHVTFLSEEPLNEREKSINRQALLPDEFVIKGKELYLYCPDGYGRTKLTNPFFEGKLKVTATTRNWKTVATLVEVGKEMVTG